jgi:hypothetical protein
MNDVVGHEATLGFVAVDRPVGAHDGAVNGAIVAVVRRRGERGRRIVIGMVIGMILRMSLRVTVTVMKLIMTLTGTGKGTGLMISGMPRLVTMRGRNRQSRRRREEGGRGHVSRASGLLVIGFGTRISCLFGQSRIFGGEPG